MHSIKQWKAIWKRKFMKRRIDWGWSGKGETVWTFDGLSRHSRGLEKRFFSKWIGFVSGHFYRDKRKALWEKAMHMSKQRRTGLKNHLIEFDRWNSVTIPSKDSFIDFLSNCNWNRSWFWIETASCWRQCQQVVDFFFEKFIREKRSCSRETINQIRWIWKKELTLNECQLKKSLLLFFLAIRWISFMEFEKLDYPARKGLLTEDGAMNVSVEKDGCLFAFSWSSDDG